MFSKRMSFALMAVALILITLLLVQCGATPAPVIGIQTVIVEKEVQGETVKVVETVEVVVTMEVEKEVVVTQEVEVEKEVVVTATPEPVEEPVILRFGQNAADLGSWIPTLRPPPRAAAWWT